MLFFFGVCVKKKQEKKMSKEVAPLTPREKEILSTAAKNYTDIVLELGKRHYDTPEIQVNMQDIGVEICINAKILDSGFINELFEAKNNMISVTTGVKRVNLTQVYPVVFLMIKPEYRKNPFYFFLSEYTFKFKDKIFSLLFIELAIYFLLSVLFSNFV